MKRELTNHFKRSSKVHIFPHVPFPTILFGRELIILRHGVILNIYHYVRFVSITGTNAKSTNSILFCVPDSDTVWISIKQLEIRN